MKRLWSSSATSVTEIGRKRATKFGRKISCKCAPLPLPPESVKKLLHAWKHWTALSCKRCWNRAFVIRPTYCGSQTEFDVLFLSGIGEIFPYIRSHNVLNNLQSTAKTKPTILFFPGEYRHSLEQGASLELFGLLHDDKYYRAFNIYEIQV